MIIYNTTMYDRNELTKFDGRSHDKVQGCLGSFKSAKSIVISALKLEITKLQDELDRTEKMERDNVPMTENPFD